MKVNQQITEFLKHLPDEKTPLVVILGPTASGKTSLSVDLAKEFDGEIISADSRQIYKYMDIGTAKIRQEEMGGVSHYMLDVVEPDEVLTLFDYKKMAEEKIEDVWKRGKTPFLVGGTGLYIRSITDGYSMDGPPADESLRRQLEKEAEDYGKEYVWKKLEKLNPEAASKIHFNNLRYVIRAIEKSQESLVTSCESLVTNYQTIKIGIEWPRETLYNRVNERVEEQIQQGLIEETEKLLKNYDRSLPSMTGLGYPQIAQYIDGKLSLEEAKDLLKKETRHYAKRQLTWFRRENDINWITL